MSRTGRAGNRNPAPDRTVLLEIILAVATLPADSTDPHPARETAEYRACHTEGSEVFGQIVHTPWTTISWLEDDVEVVACVMRGEPDAFPAFLRDADHVVFALVAHGEALSQPNVSFAVHLDSGRTIELGPGWIRVKPHGALTCRVDLCEAFGAPGERVELLSVQTHPPTRGAVRRNRR